MSETTNTPLPAKEQIALVRARRGPIAPDLLQRNKAQSKAQRAILTSIATDAKTVPEISEETGLETQFVFWLIAGLRKYNKAESVKKRGEYMTYRKKDGGE